MNCILNPQSAVMKNLRGMLTALGLAAFLASGLPLQAANPDFQNTSPRGAKRGSEVTVEFTGSRLDDAEELLFHHPGITFKDLKYAEDDKKKKKLTATLVIAPDAQLGEHHIRIRCKTGISYARTFWVSQFDNVAEVEPNDSFEEPQSIPMNVTVTASAKPEEVDFYKVTAKKGQRISVEIEGLRINNIRNAVAIDPYVAILDKDRFELAVSDDSALLKQESVISVVAPEDGDYTIEIRDASYQGRGDYRAHIGTFPRPLSIYPAGAKVGADQEFTLLGDPKGSYKAKAKMPAETRDEYEVFGANENLIPPSGNKVRVSAFDNVLETEPNNTKEEATAATSLPLAFNGVLAEPGDTDYFKFTAKKGERYRFKSYAERIGSPVDTVIYVYNEKGGQVGSNDDADGSKDSRFDFNCPADGIYFVRIKDMLDRGGENFVYRIESEPYTPGILVTMPEMLRRDNQYRKQFNIPRGNQFAMTVNVSRQNVSGDLVFDLPKLPAGVTWEAGTIPKNLSQFPILLKAAPDAPIGGGMFDLNVKTVDKEKPIVSGKYDQEIAFVRGNPNGVAYYTRSNDSLPIAVVEKVPFNITIDQPKAPLVRDGTMKLKIRAHRHDGYDKKILVRMLWRPPGISCPATMTFNEKDTELEYELNANANAELNSWKITVLAETDDGKGQMVTAAPYVDVKVEEPFVGMKLNLTTVKQGQNSEMLANLEQLRDFEGEAEVQLFGLPAKATTPPVKITKGSTEIRFPITTAEDTPVGQHKNMFCTLVLTQNGEPVAHRVGMGGVLRVDPKPKEPAKPKPSADPKKAAVAKAPAAKPEKPLSRLEQLRLEAKNAAAAK